MKAVIRFHKYGMWKDLFTWLFCQCLKLSVFLLACSACIWTSGFCSLLFFFYILHFTCYWQLNDSHIWEIQGSYLWPLQMFNIMDPHIIRLIRLVSLISLIMWEWTELCKTPTGCPNARLKLLKQRKQDNSFYNFFWRHWVKCQDVKRQYFFHNVGQDAFDAILNF